MCTYINHSSRQWSHTYSHFTDDLAVDWINDKVYWTDAVHARIEVIDIDSKKRKELLRTGPNSVPRAIAVDPSTRLALQNQYM